ncbi:MAG TPA: hypothetical protein VEF53_14640 [Patescibacteria group bacterium]|nr:hypothetical protein [Patescibacteria group bacterium]
MLQHAHNPADWFHWGDDAFHWCHARYPQQSLRP